MVTKIYHEIFGQIPDLLLTRQYTYRSIFENKQEVKDNNTNLPSIEDSQLNLATTWLEEMMASTNIPKITWNANEVKGKADFFDANEQIQMLKQILKDLLPFQVFEEITTYVARKNEKKFASIENLFQHYLHSITNEKLSSDDFLKKVSPGLIAMDLRVIYTFENIEKDYLNFLDELQQNKSESVFERYYLHSDIFTYLNEGLSTSLIQCLIPKLNVYAYELTKVDTYLQNFVGEKLESLIAALSHRFNSDSADLNFGETLSSTDLQIVEQLINAWNQFFTSFEKSVLELKELNELVLLSLYGGLLLRASSDFSSLGMTVKELFISPASIKLEFNKECIDDAIYDFNETLIKIEDLKVKGEWQKAATFSDEVFRLIQTDEMIKARNVSPFGSAIYVAGITKYANAFVCLANIENDKIQFINKFENLYSSLNVIIKDEDLLKLEITQQFNSLIKYMNILVELNCVQRVSVVFDYAVRMIERFDKGLLFQGEDIRENDKFYSLLILIAEYVQKQGVDHRFVDLCHYNDLDSNMIEELLTDYTEMVGIDDFVKNFQTNLAAKLVKLVTGTTRNLSKRF